MKEIASKWIEWIANLLLGPAYDMDSVEEEHQKVMDTLNQSLELLTERVGAIESTEIYSEGLKKALEESHRQKATH